MRTGVTLADLRKELQIEAGLTTSATASQSVERLNHILNRTERLLYATGEWASQDHEEEVIVPANSQFVNLPNQITFTEVDYVHVLYGDDWLEISHGIGPHERSVYSGTQRATPIQRWEVRAPGNTDFEVWPVGNVEQTLRFKGSKTIGGMVQDIDTCTLDGDVLVLSAAAEILGRDRKEDAALKLEMAKSLKATILKKQGAAKRETLSLSGGHASRLRPGIDYIPPGSS